MKRLFKYLFESCIAYLYPVLGRMARNIGKNTLVIGAYVFPFHNIKVGSNNIICSGAVLNAVYSKDIITGDNCVIKKHAMLLCYGGSIRIGNNVAINPFTVIYGHGGVLIGNNVIIASHVTIISNNHKFTELTKPICEQGEESKGIAIEDDVWIGAGVIIVDGVRIGKGSVIGAGSVVTKDIPHYSVAVGVPCKVIKTRGK